jgi:hypothetical protein
MRCWPASCASGTNRDHHGPPSPELTVVGTVSGEATHEAFTARAAGADLPAARVRARQILWLGDGEAAGQVGAAEGAG